MVKRHKFGVADNSKQKRSWCQEIQFWGLGELFGDVDCTNFRFPLAISSRWDRFYNPDYIYIYIYRLQVFTFSTISGSSYEYSDYSGEEYDYNDYKDYQEGETTQIPVIIIFIFIISKIYSITSYYR